MVTPPRSAYVHIPFCHKRCFYCDFSIIPLGDSAEALGSPGITSINAYLDLLHREISIAPKGPALSTVYLGGGTPSLLKKNELDDLLKQLKRKFGFQDGVEITMEVDPATFLENELKGYLEIGINRMSLGGQAFDDTTLSSIGRKHNRSQLIEACNWLNNLFKEGMLRSWSLDLIQNLPGLNLTKWLCELEQAVQTEAPHLSIYDLTIEPETVFGRRHKKGLLKIPNESLAQKIDLETNKYLKSRGFSRYEISSYSLPGHASRHNRMYWAGSGWWGFGMGATSSPWGKRFSRPRTIVSYKKWVEKQESQLLEKTLFNEESSRMPLDELLMIGLRRREGVHFEELAKSVGWTQKECEKNLRLLEKYWITFLTEGYLLKKNGRYCLSDPKGMQISNQILIQMFLWWDSLTLD
ncbi:radical SAM family heme chaperone HemW [Prochlorococcus marinus]|uniref:Heme chaperone HemW n=1 Tax=Prochlorococcus marinus XMU1408 TaxID=2213228 RepID=A0A318R2S6_PROMR|nr:radical SAM family heme chaperone HemW [Prochlorococcus marinus]MBW3042490.1 radical SAM protein [Prochlorococcus marinus str. XMU1408]PYE01221.1 radical SAM protein [Prochlorococcus marinus XMU1408]